MASLEMLKAKRKIIEGNLYHKIDMLNKEQVELNRKRKATYEHYNAILNEIDEQIAILNGRCSESSRPQ